MATSVQRRVAAVAIAVAVVATALLASNGAQSQINATPSWVSMGVSSSGGGSTAWFHEPTSRQVVACRTNESTGGSTPSIQCVSAKLP